MTKDVLRPCDVKLSNDLHALTAAFDAFRELMDERDKRYAELDRSNKDAIRAAFNSAERAAEKTELALKEYKVGANEWRDTVRDVIGKTTGHNDAVAAAQVTQRWMIGLAVMTVLSLVANYLK